MTASPPPGLSRASFDAAVRDGIDMPYERPGPDPVTADDVRAECARRMCIVVGARSVADLAVKLSNALRETARLQDVRLDRAWTPEEAGRAAVLRAGDAEIERLRVRSNALEPDPPVDFADDRHWLP